MKKRKSVFVFLFLFLAFSAVCPASAKSKTNATDSITNEWHFFPGVENGQRFIDMAFMDGIASFNRIIYNYYNVVLLFCTFFFFINICYHSFRLWLGMGEIRKIAIEMFWKVILVYILVIAYKPIVNGVLNEACLLGRNGADGYEKVVNSVYNMYAGVANRFLASRKNLEYFFKNNDVEIDDAMKKQYAEAFNLDEATATQKLSSYGVKLVTDKEYKKDTKKFDSAANSTFHTINSYDSGTTAKIYGEEQAKEIYDKAVEQAKKSWTQARIENELNNLSKTMDQMKAYSDLMIDGNSEVDDSDLFLINPDYDESNRDTGSVNKYYVNEAVAKERMAQYMYNPFLQQYASDGTPLKDNIFSAVFSPVAIMKTGILVCKLLLAANGENFAYSKSNQDKKAKDGKFELVGIKTIFKNLLVGLFNLIITLILCLVIIFCIVFAMIQYCSCILEYFIVTGIGFLFVPCLLWEGTKQYAVSLVKMFFGFFIKLLVMNLCMFYTISMYIDMAEILSASTMSTTIEYFCYAAFVLLFGLMLSQNAPQIALTLVTGDPKLSMGEFVHAAGTVAGAAHFGKGVAKKAVGATQTVGRGAASLAGGAAAVASIPRAWKNETGSSKGAVGATVKGAVGMMGRGVLNGTSKLLAGRGNSVDEKTGRITNEFGRQQKSHADDTNSRLHGVYAKDANGIEINGSNGNPAKMLASGMAVKMTKDGGAMFTNAGAKSTASAMAERPRQVAEKAAEARAARFRPEVVKEDAQAARTYARQVWDQNAQNREKVR